MSDDPTQLLLTYLHERDVPCPRCTYNLRSAAQPRCSECGLPIELGVRATIIITGHWVAAMTIYGSSALLGLFFITLVMKAGWPEDRFSVTNAVLIGYMLHIPLAIVLLISRRRFVRVPAAVQRMIWIIGAILAAALLLMLVAFLR